MSERPGSSGAFLNLYLWPAAKSRTSRFYRLIHKMMMLGSKGHKSDASLLAGGFLNLGPAKNMSKKPFFEEK